MAHDERAIIAANNNADLYEAVFAALGLRYERRPFAFVSQVEPPPYYSHLTVLAPDCLSQIVPQLRASAHRLGSAISVKDSFCELPMGDGRLTLLFEACWLWRSAEAASLPKGWVTVESALDLVAWEAAWKRSGSPANARIFRSAILGSPDILFLGKKHAGEFVSGCIANRSSACAGISNVFGPDEGAFDEATAALASTYPLLPIVGYAGAPRLGRALASGYQVTGALRVLETSEAII